MFLTMPIQTEGYSQEHLAWISERYIDIKYLILNEQEIQLSLSQGQGKSSSCS